jgi:hypothetical protein
VCTTCICIDSVQHILCFVTGVAHNLLPFVEGGILNSFSNIGAYYLVPYLLALFVVMFGKRAARFVFQSFDNLHRRAHVCSLKLKYITAVVQHGPLRQMQLRHTVATVG